MYTFTPCPLSRTTISFILATSSGVKALIHCSPLLYMAYHTHTHGDGQQAGGEQREDGGEHENGGKHEDDEEVTIEGESVDEWRRSIRSERERKREKSGRQCR